MDFTPATYTRLPETLQASVYSFQTIAGFFESAEYKTVLLRYDVDLLPKDALYRFRLKATFGKMPTPFVTRSPRLKTYAYTHNPDNRYTPALLPISAQGHFR